MKLWQGVCKNKMAKMRLQMLSGSGTREYLLPFALSLLLLSIFVLRFLTSSFWLDETMTYWVIKTSFVDAVHRSIHFQGPGPLHYLVAWMFKTLLGSSEPAIRLPSLLAFVALCSVFYKLTCLVFDRRLALLSLAVMLSLSGIAEVAIVARTYSLSLFVITLSSLMLLRWGGDAQKPYRICYILSASLIVYTQVVFGAVYLFHGLYMFYARRKNKTFTLWQIASSFIVIFILSSPCLYQLSILASKRHIMAYAGSPTALDLLSALLPQRELLILLFSVVVACILMQSRKLKPHFYRLPYGIFVLLWYVVPLLSVFCFSVVSGNSIFDARYYFWFSPALALLITHVLDAFQSRYLRLTAACLFIVLMFIKSFITNPFVEDWRGAISAAAKIVDLHDVKVIASTGLAESADIEWVTKPAQRDYLLAPFSLYHLGTDAILLPATIENTASSAYWRNSVLSEIADVERLVLIVRMTYVQDRDGNLVTSDVYYTKKLEGHGATHTRSQEFGHVRVLEFEF